MDCFQPLMLNDATNGKAWKEHDVRRSWVMNRNKNTRAGSEELWQFAKENFIDPNVENGNIIDDREEK